MNEGAFSFITSMAVTGMFFVNGLQIIPPPSTAHYFDVRSVSAERVGDTAHLHIDRIIHAPIEMSWTVRVMEEADDGWRQVCQASSGVFQYRPEARLPVPTSLEWWTDGQCVDLPPGPARIITTWTPQRAGLDPVTYIARVE